MVNHVRRGLVVNHLYLEPKGLTSKPIPQRNILNLNFPTNIPLLIDANWQLSLAQYIYQYKKEKRLKGRGRMNELTNMKKREMERENEKIKQQAKQ